MVLWSNKKAIEKSGQKKQKGKESKVEKTESKKTAKSYQDWNPFGTDIQAIVKHYWRTVLARLTPP